MREGSNSLLGCSTTIVWGERSADSRPYAQRPSGPTAAARREKALILRAGKRAGAAMPIQARARAEIRLPHSRCTIRLTALSKVRGRAAQYADRDDAAAKTGRVLPLVSNAKPPPCGDLGDRPSPGTLWPMPGGRALPDGVGSNTPYCSIRDGAWPERSPVNSALASPTSNGRSSPVATTDTLNLPSRFLSKMAPTIMSASS